MSNNRKKKSRRQAKKGNTTKATNRQACLRPAKPVQVMESTSLQRGSEITRNPQCDGEGVASESCRRGAVSGVLSDGFCGVNNLDSFKLMAQSIDVSPKARPACVEPQYQPVATVPLDWAEVKSDVTVAAIIEALTTSSVENSAALMQVLVNQILTSSALWTRYVEKGVWAQLDVRLIDVLLVRAESQGEERAAIIALLRYLIENFSPRRFAVFVSNDERAGRVEKLESCALLIRHRLSETKISVQDLPAHLRGLEADQAPKSQQEKVILRLDKAYHELGLELFKLPVMSEVLYELCVAEFASAVQLLMAFKLKAEGCAVRVQFSQEGEPFTHLLACDQYLVVMHLRAWLGERYYKAYYAKYLKAVLHDQVLTLSLPCNISRFAICHALTPYETRVAYLLEAGSRLQHIRYTLGTFIWTSLIKLAVKTTVNSSRYAAACIKANDAGEKLPSYLSTCVELDAPFSQIRRFIQSKEGKAKLKGSFKEATALQVVFACVGAEVCARFDTCDEALVTAAEEALPDLSREQLVGALVELRKNKCVYEAVAPRFYARVEALVSPSTAAVSENKTDEITQQKAAHAETVRKQLIAEESAIVEAKVKKAAKNKKQRERRKARRKSNKMFARLTILLQKSYRTYAFAQWARVVACQKQLEARVGNLTQRRNQRLQLTVLKAWAARVARKQQKRHAKLNVQRLTQRRKQCLQARVLRGWAGYVAQKKQRREGVEALVERREEQLKARVFFRWSAPVLERKQAIAVLQRKHALRRLKSFVVSLRRRQQVLNQVLVDLSEGVGTFRQHLVQLQHSCACEEKLHERLFLSVLGRLIERLSLLQGVVSSWQGEVLTPKAMTPQAKKIPVDEGFSVFCQLSWQYNEHLASEVSRLAKLARGKTQAVTVSTWLSTLQWFYVAPLNWHSLNVQRLHYGGVQAYVKGSTVIAGWGDDDDIVVPIQQREQLEKLDGCSPIQGSEVSSDQFCNVGYRFGNFPLALDVTYLNLPSGDEFLAALPAKLSTMASNVSAAFQSVRDGSVLMRHADMRSVLDKQFVIHPVPRGVNPVSYHAFCFKVLLKCVDQLRDWCLNKAAGELLVRLVTTPPVDALVFGVLGLFKKKYWANASRERQGLYGRAYSFWASRYSVKPANTVAGRMEAIQASRGCVMGAAK